MSSMIKPRPMPPFELRDRTPAPKRGRKTTEWEQTRARLKIRFRKAGITECEIKLPQCWCTGCLSFAHTKKRGDIINQTELEEVVLACGACHTSVEGLEKEEMYALLKKIIQERAVQP